MTTTTAWPAGTLPSRARPGRSSGVNIKPALLSAISAAMLLAGPASGESLRIVTIQGPPWGFTGNDGKPTGMMYDIGNRIAQEAGFRYSNTLVPYARTALEIETGSADFTLRFGNEQMARNAVAVATIVSMPVILVGPGGTRFSSLDELHGKTVGVVRSSRYEPRFDADTAIQKYAVNDYAIMSRMLAKRRLDAGVGSSVGLYYGAYMAGVKPEELGPPLVLGSNDFVLFFSRKNAKPETLKALKDAVTKLHDSGEIRQIMGRYTKSFGIDPLPK